MPKHLCDLFLRIHTLSVKLVEKGTYSVPVKTATKSVKLLSHAVNVPKTHHINEKTDTVSNIRQKLYK